MKHTRISNAELKKAAQVVGTAMLASLPNPEQCSVELSPAFEASMTKLMAGTGCARQAAPKNRIMIYRVAAALFALVIGLGILFSASEPVRAEVIRLAREVYENSVIYRMLNSSSAEECDLPELSVSNLPQGYTEVRRDGDSKHIRVIVYENDCGGAIVLTYSRLSEVSVWYVNETGHGGEQVSLGVLYGDFYPAAENTPSNDLVWADEKKDLLFILSANQLGKDELVSIAKDLFFSF